MYASWTSFSPITANNAFPFQFPGCKLSANCSASAASASSLGTSTGAAVLCYFLGTSQRLCALQNHSQRRYLNIILNRCPFRNKKISSYSHNNCQTCHCQIPYHFSSNPPPFFRPAKLSHLLTLWRNSPLAESSIFFRKVLCMGSSSISASGTSFHRRSPVLLSHVISQCFHPPSIQTRFQA